GGMQKRLEGALRAGSAEFDSYLTKVVLEKIDIQASGNMLGMTRLIANGRLYNRGDRTLTGIELTAIAYNLENKVAAQNTSQPIPNKRPEPLKPGESILVETIVDLPANIREGDIMDVKQSISGLTFQ
ncbi:MAG TPA: hypothetical protein VEF04_08790, partial [Blastocatellia bacterium]|nr:hypothetical protein [Blastocatellia bacterium]